MTLIKDDAASFTEMDIERLQSHLMDIQANTASHFRSENIRKLYHVNTQQTGVPPGVLIPYPVTSYPLNPKDGYPFTPKEGPDPDSQPYHDHLTSSFQAFRVRKWRPLTPEQSARDSVTRCRPISARPSSSHSARLTTPIPPRPLSETLLSTNEEREGGGSRYRMGRPDTPRVNPGNFDTLSPRVLSEFISDLQPQPLTSTYGDNLMVAGKAKKLTRKKMARRSITTLASYLENGGDGQIGEVDGESDSIEDVDDSDDSDGSADSDNESISELEKGKEPPIDYNCKIPDLHLRPERLDHVYTPENKRDLRRFDFNAENVEYPPYEFECPIPAPFTRINFRYHAREGTDWREMIPQLGDPDPILAPMFDRLLELEALQIGTEDWEEKRTRQVRRRPASRAVSASRSASRRCCPTCLQPACVGDCPNKRIPSNCCELCYQPFCTGNCSETKYEQRMRQPRIDPNATLPPRPAVPRNCTTCQRKHTAKLINANYVVLGRPKSAFATYSKGKQSSKPRDLRPKSALEASETITKGIEKLGLEPTQPTPPSSAKPPRPRSRSGIMPGKTYFSNLSRSLTDLSTKRRKRSAKSRKVRVSTA